VAIHFNHSSTPISELSPVSGGNPRLTVPWDQFFRQLATNSSTHFDNETPGGVIDGVNTVFTLFASPNPLACLQLWQKPSAGVAFPLFQGIDYTLARNVITFTTAPAIGSTLRAFYRQ
jgi:hypothetical protein